MKCLTTLIRQRVKQEQTTFRVDVDASLFAFKPRNQRALMRKLAEDGRIAVRNVRRDVMHHLKELSTKGEVGDDDERRAEEHVQKLTDDHTKTIDDLLRHKEAEIMEV